MERDSGETVLSISCHHPELVPLCGLTSSLGPAWPGLLSASAAGQDSGKGEARMLVPGIFCGKVGALSGGGPWLCIW